MVGGNWSARRSALLRKYRNDAGEWGWQWVLPQGRRWHNFRQLFVTHQLEQGADICRIQELLGHSDAKTTMVYTHVLNRRPFGVQSPADLL
jgi:site-specific recombinase XerC